jgi:hypothetical protein
VAATITPAPTGWGDRCRLHSASQNLPPIEWEHRHAFAQSLASTMAA